jgi:hypothetical protein
VTRTTDIQKQRKKSKKNLKKKSRWTGQAETGRRERKNDGGCLSGFLGAVGQKAKKKTAGRLTITDEIFAQKKVSKERGNGTDRLAGLNQPTKASGTSVPACRGKQQRSSRKSR